MTIKMKATMLVFKKITKLVLEIADFPETYFNLTLVVTALSC